MKLTKVFGLVLVLSMMLLCLQYHLRRPGLTRVRSILQEVVHARNLRRDPHGMFCRLPPSKEQITRRNQTGTTSGFIRIPEDPLLNLENNNKNNQVPQPEEEAQNIVFINGHRTGGTTVQNILLRFAMTRNLNVLLPYISLSNSINEVDSHINLTQVVPVPKGQSYNILCHRIIFNKEILSKFFPTSSVYVGILRHPLYQSASALYHYALREKTNPDNKNSKYTLAFQANPKNPFHAFVTRTNSYDEQPPNLSYTNNRQAIDLGYPITPSFQTDKNDTSKISKFVEEIDKQFRVMLITEMFDESLVLLRRVLHWKMEDIIYAKLGVSTKANHLTDINGLSDVELLAHRKSSAIDYALYDHFISKLEGLVIAQGDGFQEELKTFREIQGKVKGFCKMIKQSFRSVVLRIQGNEWSDGFCLTPSFCEILQKDGPDMTQLVRRQQLENVDILPSLSSV